MSRVNFWGMAVLVSATVLTSQAKASGWEKVCELRVDKDVANVYIQEMGMWRKKTGPNTYTTKIGVKVYDIYKSCFILDPKANITITAKSSAGGFAKGTIHWDPRAHLKGSWAYRDFKNLFVKDCGGGFQYHVHSYCQ